MKDNSFQHLFNHFSSIVKITRFRLLAISASIDTVTFNRTRESIHYIQTRCIYVVNLSM